MSPIHTDLDPKTWLLWLGLAWLVGLTAGIILLTAGPILAISTATLAAVLLTDIGLRNPKPPQRVRHFIDDGDQSDDEKKSES
jgi:hypothetical protein